MTNVLKQIVIITIYCIELINDIQTLGRITAFGNGFLNLDIWPG